LGTVTVIFHVDDGGYFRRDVAGLRRYPAREAAEAELRTQSSLRGSLVLRIYKIFLARLADVGYFCD